ncbi:MAG: hypothetical protein FWH03_07355 [Firmicutes bacterium]|nr:hypothetical protein [Bacillota bacterium]
MAQSLYDIMDDSDECIVEFERACAELASAKYILAEKKISALLQVIAKSKNLYALIGACMQDFDFAAELKHAKTQNGLMLPASRKKQIAFVFCLLLSFDTNQTDFKKFLHTFYANPDGANSEFSDFCKRIIVPFYANVKKAYFAEADEPNSAPKQDSFGHVSYPHMQSQPENANPLENAFSESKPAPAQSALNSLALTSLGEAAREIIGIAARDSQIPIKEREEILLVCEGFAQAVQLGQEKAIRTMYIALKNTIRCSPMARQLEVQSEGLAQLITEYSLD